MACVNIFEPHLGNLVRKTNIHTRERDYAIEFFEEAITEFTNKRLTGVYKNGCFARELLEEKSLELTKSARSAVIKLNNRKTATNDLRWEKI